VEIQDFAVLEVVTTRVKIGGHLTSFGNPASIHTAGVRRRWIFRPAQQLKEALKLK